jgi:vanillate O-demethylase monooxygenase subunit
MTAIDLPRPPTRTRTHDDGTAFLAAARPFWHPVAASASLEPGGLTQVTLLDEELVLWRDYDGRAAVATDTCIHRGVQLSRGAVATDGCVTCPYHGWRYASDGRCTHIPQLTNGVIPAVARIEAYEVDEHAGLIWVRLGNGDDAPLPPRPELPEAHDPGYVLHVGTPFDWSCQSTRQLENFLDVAHFSHIHLDVFGNPDAMEVPPQPVEVADGHLRTEVVYPAVDPTAPLRGEVAEVIQMRFVYDVHLPFAVRLRSGVVDEPMGTLFMVNQPITAHTCRVWWVMAQVADTALPPELLEMMEQLIFGADQAIVETQRPDAVPLAMTAELHLPFDKVAVAYRRALAALGFAEDGSGLVGSP